MPFIWCETQEMAFLSLQAALITQLVLAHFVPTRTTLLGTRVGKKEGRFHVKYFPLKFSPYVMLRTSGVFSCEEAVFPGSPKFFRAAVDSAGNSSREHKIALLMLQFYTYRSLSKGRPIGGYDDPSKCRSCVSKQTQKSKEVWVYAPQIRPRSELLFTNKQIDIDH